MTAKKITALLRELSDKKSEYGELFVMCDESDLKNFIPLVSIKSENNEDIEIDDFEMRINLWLAIAHRG